MIDKLKQIYQKILGVFGGIFRGEDGQWQGIPMLLVTALLLTIGFKINSWWDDRQADKRYNEKVEDILKVSELELEKKQFEIEAVQAAMEAMNREKQLHKEHNDVLKKQLENAREHSQEFSDCLDTRGPNLLR